jgi:hypothetical protein
MLVRMHPDGLMDYKKWKSGRHDPKRVTPLIEHDPELYHSLKAAQRFRNVCQYCMKHKRTCPMCAGVT